MSTQQKEEGCTEDVTLNKTESTDEKKKKVVKRKKRRKRRRTSSSEAARDELDMCRTFQQRYGTKKKVQDETKEALFNPNNGQIFHPSSYERMMTRSIEAHLNRLLQPEPPDDLVNSNWLCALCLKPAFADEQGDLYGPYFVRLSSDCQPPAELLMKHQSVRPEPEANGSLITVHRVNSKGVPKAVANSNKLEVERRASPSKRSSKTFPIQGSLDIWLHGDCALWTPGLFMVGGRFPTLQLHIQRYWKQVEKRNTNWKKEIPFSIIK